MSREIKFRYWDGTKYLPKTQMPWLDQNGMTWGKSCCHWGQDEEMWHGLIVEQFTGLKDSKGVDIYEGDILRRDYRSKVEQYNTSQEWLGWSEKEYDNYYLYEVVYSTSTFTINCNEYSILMNGFGAKRIFNSNLTASDNESRYGNISPLGLSFSSRNYGAFGFVASEMTLVGNIHEHLHLLT